MTSLDVTILSERCICVVPVKRRLPAVQMTQMSEDMSSVWHITAGWDGLLLLQRASRMVSPSFVTGVCLSTVLNLWLEKAGKFGAASSSVVGGVVQHGGLTYGRGSEGDRRDQHPKAMHRVQKALARKECRPQRPKVSLRTEGLGEKHISRIDEAGRSSIIRFPFGKRMTTISSETVSHSQKRPRVGFKKALFPCRTQA